MDTYRISEHQSFSTEHHAENILCRPAGGDVSVACHEPNQVGPYHSHPQCTEIYLCVQGSGTMRTAGETVSLSPGVILVHPPGEPHQFAAGPERTLLFRVRYGGDFTSRHHEWPGNPS